MTALVADMAGPQHAVLGVMALAGVFGAVGIVRFGFWLLRLGRRPVEPGTDQKR